MKFNLKHPEHGEVRPPLSKEVFFAKTGKRIIRFRDWFYWTGTNVIVMYARNRGGKNGLPHVCDGVVQHIRENWLAESFSELKVALVDDVLRDQYRLPKQAKAITSDGHNRTMAGFLRYYDGNFTKEDLDKEVCLSVCESDKFLSVYCSSHIQAASSAAQMLANPDLLFGDLIFNRLCSQLTPEMCEIIASHGTKFLPQLSYLLYSLGQKIERWHYLYVFRTRVTSKALRTLPAGSRSLGLTNENFNILAEACNFYEEYITRLDQVVRDSGVDYSDFKTVSNSGPYFGVIAADFIGDEMGVLPKDRKIGTFVNQSKKNLSKLASAVTSITNSSDNAIYTAVDRIVKILHPR